MLLQNTNPIPAISPSPASGRNARPPMFLAIVGTQILAVLICGFGWVVPAILWMIFGMVWLYMLAWMIALDTIRLALYSRLRMSAPVRTGIPGFPGAGTLHRPLPDPGGRVPGAC